MPIEARLFSRIEANVQLRKLEKHSSTKQQWIKEAIKDKLLKDKNDPEHIPENKYLRIEIEPTLQDDIEKRVELLKQRSGRNYSTKKWMIEAFHEKLERDEAHSQKIMKKLLNSFKTTKGKV